MPASSSNTSKLNPKPALQPPTTCYSTPIRDHKPASQSKPPKNHILHSEITSKVDGQSLGEMLQVWKDIAASEVRINTLEALKTKKIGLREIEQYSLGLRYGFRSRKMQNGSSKPVEGVVEASMMIKIKDEKQNRRELEERREDMKRWLAKKYHTNNKNYKKIIQYLRQEASTEKTNLEDKNRKKISHLEEKYRRREEDREEEIPAEMEQYSNLSIFSEEKFNQKD